MANGRIPEGPHQEEVGVHLPLELVVALQHAGLVVGRHQPLEVAGVELLVRREGHILLNLLEGPLSPLLHEEPQVQIIVNGVIVEFLFLDPVG